MVSRRFPSRIAPFSRRQPTLILFGLAVLLVGCTSAKTTRERSVPSPASGLIAKPASTILGDARRQLLATPSVRVRGTLTQALPAAASGKTSDAKKSSVQQRLDLRLGRGSKGQALASGTITTVAAAGGRPCAFRSP